MRRLALISAIATLTLAGCGTSTASTKPADACGTAFAAAAGVDKNADTVADLYPAIRACATVDAWSAAFTANNGAGFTGSATEVLTNACSAQAVVSEPLCQFVK
jgi:hypothetical protein